METQEMPASTFTDYATSFVSDSDNICPGYISDLTDAYHKAISEAQAKFFCDLSAMGTEIPDQHLPALWVSFGPLP